MRKVVSRERVLSDAELAKVWHATDVLHAPRRDAVRFLMLTGLRRSEGTEIRLVRYRRRRADHPRQSHKEWDGALSPAVAPGSRPDQRSAAPLRVRLHL